MEFPIFIVAKFLWTFVTMYFVLMFTNTMIQNSTKEAPESVTAFASITAFFLAVTIFIL